MIAPRIDAQALGGARANRVPVAISTGTSTTGGRSPLIEWSPAHAGRAAAKIEDRRRDDRVDCRRSGATYCPPGVEPVEPATRRKQSGPERHSGIDGAQSNAAPGRKPVRKHHRNGTLTPPMPDPP